MVCHKLVVLMIILNVLFQEKMETKDLLKVLALLPQFNQLLRTTSGPRQPRLGQRQPTPESRTQTMSKSKRRNFRRRQKLKLKKTLTNTQKSPESSNKKEEQMEVVEEIKKLPLQAGHTVAEAKAVEMIKEGQEKPQEKLEDEATALMLPGASREKFYDAPRWVKMVIRYLLRASGPTEGDRKDFLVMSTNKMLRLAKEKQKQLRQMKDKQQEIVDLRMKIQQKEAAKTALFPEGGQSQDSQDQPQLDQGQEQSQQPLDQADEAKEEEKKQKILDQMLNRSLSREESEEVLSLVDQMKATEPGILSTMNDLVENPIDTLNLFDLTIQDKFVNDNAELEEYPQLTG